MKKLLLIATLLLLASPAFAGPSNSLFDGWNTTGAGTAVTPREPYKTWFCEGRVTEASNPSSISVDVEGSVTGQKHRPVKSYAWTTADRIAKGAVFTFDGTPLNSIRGNVTAMGWNTSGQFWLDCQGVR